jgi:hypothetical protein
MFKLSRVCYAVRYVKRFMSQDTPKTIYFSYFHSILSYGIIFWGNSAYSTNIFKIQHRIIGIILSYGIIFWGNSAYSSNIFKIQHRIIRIIMNDRNRDSCHHLFKNLKTLPLKSQYISSLYYFELNFQFIIEIEKICCQKQRFI